MQPLLRLLQSMPDYLHLYRANVYLRGSLLCAEYGRRVGEGLLPLFAIARFPYRSCSVFY
jgi:hypothetical protein